MGVFYHQVNVDGSLWDVSAETSEFTEFPYEVAASIARLAHNGRLSRGAIGWSDYRLSVNWVGGEVPPIARR